MPPSRQGTGYTNLQTYLGLNQGAAQRMGNTLAGDVEAEGSKVSNNVNDAYAKFVEQSQKGTLDRPKAPGNITSVEAQRRSQQGYTGPVALGGAEGVNIGELMSSAATAQNKANAIGTNEGRQTLLSQKYGQGTWGGGALDAALAGAGGAGGRLSAAQGSYGKLLSSLNATQQKAATAADAAKAESEKNAKWYGEQVPVLQAKEAADKAAAQAAAEQKRTERQREDVTYRTDPHGRDNTVYDPEAAPDTRTLPVAQKPHERYRTTDPKKPRFGI